MADKTCTIAIQGGWLYVRLVPSERVFVRPKGEEWREHGVSWLATTKFLAYIDSYKDNQKIPKDLTEFVANNPIDPYIEEQLPAWQAMARRLEAAE